MVSLVFLATGAAGLAYEVVWTRWLELLLGSSTWAATAVLAAFMGGLALGGVIFGKIADRVERRLSLYGWLEIGVGLYGLAFPGLLRASTGLYVSLASSFAENAPLTFALRFTLALALFWCHDAHGRNAPIPVSIYAG
jgi:MFS family permease